VNGITPPPSSRSQLLFSHSHLCCLVVLLLSGMDASQVSPMAELRFQFSVEHFERQVLSLGVGQQSVTSPFLGFGWSLMVSPRKELQRDETSANVLLCLQCHGPIDARESAGDWKSPYITYTTYFMGRCLHSRSSIQFTSGSRSGNGMLAITSFNLRKAKGMDDTIVFDCHISSAEGAVGRDVCGDPLNSSLISMLANPVESFADLRLQGGDGGDVILCHRALLRYRVDHFATLLAGGAFKEGGDDAQQVITLADVSSRALKIFIRRVYGERIPDHLSESEHADTLMELWTFGSVRLMRTLAGECRQIVERTVCGETFARFFRTAMLLDDVDMQATLAIKLDKWTQAVADSALKDSFSVEELVALLRLLPPRLNTAWLANSWLGHNPARKEHGEEVLQAIDVSKLPQAELKAFSGLQIVEDHASRECLLHLLMKASKFT
jgi:hypothetical protein